MQRFGEAAVAGRDEVGTIIPATSNYLPTRKLPTNLPVLRTQDCYPLCERRLAAATVIVATSLRIEQGYHVQKERGREECCMTNSKKEWKMTTRISNGDR